MANPRAENDQGIFYCATCGGLGENDQGHPIGTPFECPNSKDHFAEIVKSPAGEFWLRVEYRIWKCQELSPLHLFRFEGRAGLYHVCRLLLLISVLLWAEPSGHWINRYVPGIIAAYALYDILLLSTFATFVSRYPAHALRSLLLNLSSFFQCGIAYAVFYRLAGNAFSPHLATVDSIYFSIVTIATVGYGDIVVSHSSGHANLVELLIVSEIVAGLYMLAGLVAVVANWANQMPISTPAKPLSELRNKNI